MISLLKKQVPPAVCFCLLLLQPALIARPNVAVVNHAPQRGQEVFITDVELARDDGAGGHGQVVKGFRRTDNPIHCVVTLSRAEEGTRVRFVWTAVAAGGKSEETLASTEVVTRGREIVADGSLRLPREWPVGRYRVQATANRSTKTVEFSIN